MPWLTRRSAPYESNEEHLRDELARVAGFLRAQLLRFRLAYPEAHRERFWHLTDDHLEKVARDEDLSPLDTFGQSDEARKLLEWAAERREEIQKRVLATRAFELRLPRLTREFALSPEEVDALLLAMMPLVHSAYRHLLGVIQHDPARSLATVGLLIEMLATSAAEYASLYSRLGPAGTLARERLTVLSGADEDALVLRQLVIDQRMVAFLFGADAPDPRIAPIARIFTEPVELRALPLTPEIMSRVEMLPNLPLAEPKLMSSLRVKFLGPDAGLAIRAFATIVRGMRSRLLVIDLEAALASPLPWPVVIDLALREARLSGAIPLFTGLARLQDSLENQPRCEYLFARIAAFAHPVGIETTSTTDPGGHQSADWIPFPLGAPTVSMRESLWRRQIASDTHAVSNPDEVVSTLSHSFQLTETQIAEAWRVARGLARHRNVFIASVEAQDLYAACRQQSAKQLVSFATRIEPRPKLNLDTDVVLPPAGKRLLRELRSRISHHARVHAAMGLGDHMRLGRGVTALFVGGSGTGKTWTAEVLASEQHLDLYRIDLASVISKWVGETEKNLSRIFADAERANCMLFFDEADALFGTRGEVKNAQDRWANLDVSFLLQRIEDYAGVVILATNLRQNMDTAFQRRIHVIVEFPIPDAASRDAMWRRLLPEPPKTALDPEDLHEIAARFELTGGNIRNIVLDACFRALEAGVNHPVTTRHLIASTARELQKLARPVTRGEFGRFYDWAMDDVIAPKEAPSIPPTPPGPAAPPGSPAPTAPPGRPAPSDASPSSLPPPNSGSTPGRR